MSDTQDMVVTEYVKPPIPTTMFDWMAHIRGEEEGVTGRGPTEAEALRDLARLLWEQGLVAQVFGERHREAVAHDEAFQAALQSYAHGNGSSYRIAAAAIAAIAKLEAA